MGLSYRSGANSHQLVALAEALKVPVTPVLHHCEEDGDASCCWCGV